MYQLCSPHDIGYASLNNTCLVDMQKIIDYQIAMYDSYWKAMGH